MSSSLTTANHSAPFLLRRLFSILGCFRFSARNRIRPTSHDRFAAESSEAVLTAQPQLSRVGMTLRQALHGSISSSWRWGGISVSGVPWLGRRKFPALVGGTINHSTQMEYFL